jgi:hypothetical protein
VLSAQQCCLSVSLCCKSVAGVCVARTQVTEVWSGAHPRSLRESHTQSQRTGPAEERKWNENEPLQRKHAHTGISGQKKLCLVHALIEWNMRQATTEVKCQESTLCTPFYHWRLVT